MPAGLAYKKVVAETAFDLPKLTFQEFPAGDLVVDAYRTVTSALNPAEPVDIAIEANGAIRSDIKKGKTGQIWFADLFRVTPLGIGPDGLPGYPLVTFWANGKDLKSGFELAVAADSPAVNSDQYFLQVSGLEVDYDATKVPFGRITGLKLLPPAPAAAVPIDITDTTKCYKITTTLYVANLLGLISQFTGGALSVEAKEKDCQTKVTNLADTSHLVNATPTAGTATELKNYQAVLGYVQKFPDGNGNGVPDVPAVYMTTQGHYHKN
jgi:2',3'-cyclic-nucleotide 2'-phosphodiesterase (5'-nucleotidase family)